MYEPKPSLPAEGTQPEDYPEGGIVTPSEDMEAGAPPTGTPEPEPVARPFPSDAARGRSANRSRTVFLLASNRITAAQIASDREGVRLGKVAVRETEAAGVRGDQAELMECIDILLEAFVEKPRQADLILPEGVVKKSVISLPPVSGSKATKILRKRALQVSGLPEEELVWTCRCLGTVETSEREMTNWLVFTLSRPALHHYYDAFREAGVKVSAVYPATGLLMNLSGRGESPEDTFGEVILGDDQIVFSIHAGGSTAFTRSIRFDPSEPAADRREVLAGELQRSFLYCSQNLSAAPPSRVDILHDGKDPVGPLVSILEAQTQVEVHSIDVSPWVRSSEDGALDMLHPSALPFLIGGELRPSAAGGSGTGGGRRRTAETLDLLPKEMRPRNWSFSAKIATTLALIEVALLLFRLSGNLDTTLEKKREILASHLESRRELGPALDSLAEIDRRDRLTEQLEAKSEALVPVEYDWVSLAKDLAFVPDGMLRLHDFRAKRTSRERFVAGEGAQSVDQWSLEIDVVSPLPYREAQQLVQEYVQNLRRSQYLATVNLKPNSQANDAVLPGGVLSSFTVLGELR